MLNIKQRAMSNILMPFKDLVLISEKERSIFTALLQKKTEALASISLLKMIGLIPHAILF